ncbi:MAG: hypothetical protein EHM72_20975 [Calditrichaeota bacterium]|nr:MAG: hypothetical protein EHM72_20975 [Calditrichota bacterium]
MHYLLFYQVSPDYLQRRQEFRDAHLTLAWEAHEKGELLLGGALTDPVDTAVLLFNCESPEIIKQFVQADPYVQNGLVTSWTIREWKTVVGKEAASPIKPVI